MSLSSELITEFVKATKDDKKAATESTVYGTVTIQNGTIYVRIDGSSILTPVNTVADVQNDERVLVTIKNHMATITGNITTPSASSVVVNQISEATTEIVNDYSSVKADNKANTEEILKLKESVAGMNSLSDEVVIWVESVYENGISEVKTKSNYTFNDSGLNITTDSSDLGSRITNEGLYVARKDQPVLIANANGVNALNVTVKQYLVVGEHLRIENYNNGSGDSKRTAFFWLPGAKN